MRHKTFLGLLLVCMVAVSVTPVNAQKTGGAEKKYVIFRDDDVGLAPYELATLKAVNDVHVAERVPVTLAIVPDPGASNMQARAKGSATSEQRNGLRDSVSLRECLAPLARSTLFEFAQHGYTHSHCAASNMSEFAGVPYNVQYRAIQQGKADIQQVFGVAPRTFIPPWDTGDHNTLEAIKALGFTHYCTGRTEYSRAHGTVGGLSIEAADIALDGTSFAQLNKSFQTAHTATEQFLNDPQRDTLIIAYHFWSFSKADESVDWNRVQLLRNYITELKEHGLSFTRLDRGYTTAAAEENAAVQNMHSSQATTSVAAIPPSPAVQTSASQLSLPAIGALSFGILFGGVISVALLSSFRNRRRDRKG